MVSALDTTKSVANDEEEIIDTEKEEGLQLLLGGLSTNDFSIEAWENESVGSSNNCSEDHVESNKSTNVNATFVATAKEIRHYNQTSTILNETIVSTEVVNDDLSLFQYAYTNTHKSVQVPPVRLVQTFDRGYALVAQKCIAKNELIWTERAAVATQLPVHSDLKIANTDRSDKKSFNQQKSAYTPSAGINNDVFVKDCKGFSFPIKACQFCFRSLESVDACIVDTRFEMPRPELWIVPPMEFINDYENKSQLLQYDEHGRVQCRQCKFLFCSINCYECLVDQYGSCCQVAQAILDLPKTFSSSFGAENDNTEFTMEMQSAVVLGVKMFLRLLHQHRKQNGDLKDLKLLSSLSGDSSDIIPLEIGISIRLKDGSVQYTLEPVYQQLVQVLSMTENEKEILNVHMLQTVVAQAARNGVDFCTQSPFVPYYQALLRNLPRESKQRADLVTSVASALGSTDGTLQRGMDAQVDERVAPQVSAIFPLIARLNHACLDACNAQIQEQLYCDAHVDVVATRDIDIGQEITINYLPGGLGYGKKPTSKRKRELQAKYLFECQCYACRL